MCKREVKEVTTPEINFMEGWGISEPEALVVDDFRQGVACSSDLLPVPLSFIRVRHRDISQDGKWASVQVDKSFAFRYEQMQRLVESGFVNTTNITSREALACQLRQQEQDKQYACDRLSSAIQDLEVQKTRAEALANYLALLDASLAFWWDEIGHKKFERG